MTVKKYRYDKKLGKMIQVTNGPRADRKTPYIMGDIEPYETVGPEPGTMITSRSHHREYLRRNNLIEVGNEKKYFGLDEKDGEKNE